MKTALVLSAGGGFGAYQAGAWRVLSRHLRPDVVIGASIGSLNAWAIAGGMPADELCQFWLDLDIAAELRLRWTRPLRGFVDGAVLERVARELFERYPARLEYGAVLTELGSLRPRLYRGTEITWRHLYGSCAIPLIFEQLRFDGRLHTDGGLMGALPLWAAGEMGAEQTVAIDVWKLGLARFRKSHRPAEGTVILTPSRRLGSARQSLFWTRSLVEEWIALGEQDAQDLVASPEYAGNISVRECFERQ
ncbi:MAG: patatin-like phospholipase family protein [Bryobacteraceae bacterium]